MLKQLFAIIITLLEFKFLTTDQNQCVLPNGCTFRNIYPMTYFYLDNYMYNLPSFGIRCDIRKKNYRFEYNPGNLLNNSNECKKIFIKLEQTIEVKFRTSLTLNDDFNVRRFSDFVIQFWNLLNRKNLSQHINFSKSEKSKERKNKNDPRIIKFSNLARIDVSYAPTNQLIEIPRRHKARRMGFILEIYRSNLNFVVKEKLIRTCKDLIEANVSFPNSVFNFFPSNTIKKINIVNTHFGRPICAFIFKNVSIDSFYIWDMTNTFYKRNLLTFNNDFEKDWFDDSYVSDIASLWIFRSENIELNLNFLNPNVFFNLLEIECHESVSKIDPKIFLALPNLIRIRFEGIYFRKLIHKQGIDWIQSINSNISVNFSNFEEFQSKSENIFNISLRFSTISTCEDTFPIEDFCLYKDFPFSQLIFIYIENNAGGKTLNPTDWLNNKPCCTFRYLIDIYRNILKYNSIDLVDFLRDDLEKINIFAKYDRDGPPCDFKHLLDRCNKKNYTKTNIWDYNDWKTLNKWVQIVSTLFTYPIAIFGISTNLIFVFLITRKSNQDIFKGFKQYNYLVVISICNIIILIITIFSWMSECNNTIKILCPETRKNILVQFYRIIFKETLSFALQFMIQFAYMGFAFNRASLIGKDSGKLIKFFSELSLVKYLISSGFISCLLSVIKVFSYKVNYDRSDDEYPINQDGSVSNSVLFSLRILRRVLGTINSTTDFLNHLVFVLLNLSIDIYMLVRLKRTLKEKASKMFGDKKGEGILSANKDDEKKAKMKKELEDAMNNATKMVIFNSVLNILVKLPIIYISIVKTCERFYFSSQNYYRYKKGFYIHYWKMFKMGFLDMIPDVSGLLLVIFLAFQLFFYAHFDKKIGKAFRRIIRKEEENWMGPKTSECDNKNR